MNSLKNNRDLVVELNTEKQSFPLNYPSNSSYIFFIGLDVNFGKSTIRLHFIIIYFIFKKFQENKDQ